MSRDRRETSLDRDLGDLSLDLRWREWMRRIEAVLFASSSPVSREALSRVVGQGASVDLLIEDLGVELAGRSYEIAQVADGWILRTRAAYADVIRTAADARNQSLDLTEFDIAVLAAIAYRQPVTRKALGEIFGKEISRELIGRLRERDLIAPGPRSPTRGAAYTFVTTEAFLVAFDLRTLGDLPEAEVPGGEAVDSAPDRRRSSA